MSKYLVPFGWADKTQRPVKDKTVRANHACIVCDAEPVKTQGDICESCEDIAHQTDFLGEWD